MFVVCGAGTCSNYDEVPGSLAECRSRGHVAFALIISALVLTTMGAVFVYRSSKKMNVRVQASVWTLAMIFILAGVISWALGCLEELELQIGAYVVVTALTTLYSSMFNLTSAFMCGGCSEIVVC